MTNKVKVRGRAARIIIGFLFPPLMGSLCLLSVLFFRDIYGCLMGSCREPFSLDLLGIIPVVILFAFIFEGLQALIYALIMEYLITPKANMNNSLLVGGALGLLCGTLVPEDIFRFSLIGLIAGVITAYILKRHYIRHNSV